MRRTGNRLWLAAALVALSVWPGVAFAASSVTGTVTFVGKAPALKPLAMDADPACAKKHSGPVPSEMLALGSGNTMGNILVWVSKGLPAGKTWPAPKDACGSRSERLSVRAARAGDHGRSDIPDPQLRRHPPQRPRAPQDQQAVQPGDAGDCSRKRPRRSTRRRTVFQIKCDVHPWMSAYVGAFTHPFFSATSTDGKFTISGLDPGTYEITAWHERLGKQTASVTVGANDKKTQDFKFTMPAAK